MCEVSSQFPCFARNDYFGPWQYSLIRRTPSASGSFPLGLCRRSQQSGDPSELGPRVFLPPKEVKRFSRALFPRAPIGILYRNVDFLDDHLVSIWFILFRLFSDLLFLFSPAYFCSSFLFSSLFWSRYDDEPEDAIVDCVVLTPLPDLDVPPFFLLLRLGVPIPPARPPLRYR